MNFVRARTQEQINSRQEEIINACDELFSRYGYEGVNFKAVSEMTSFTRPSIYNYYKTKDEALMDLLRRELLHLQTRIVEVMETNNTMTKEQYSAFMTDNISSHDKMLKLISIRFTILEKNSSVDKLVDLRKDVMKTMDTIAVTLDKYFPSSAAENRAVFIQAAFAYIVGLCATSQRSEKHLEADQIIGTDFDAPNFQQMCYRGILLLLSDL